jgi:predicted dehydrogenase
MKTGKLNVAIVGCGYVAHDHVRAWRRLPYVRILAAYDVDLEKARRFSHYWNIPNAYSSFEDLLKNEEISVVDICTPPQTHLTLSIKAFKEGKHVLIEKPLAMTMKEAQEIVRQKPPDIKAGVVYNLLFEPPILKLLSIIKKGFIGQVYNARIDMLHTRQDPMLTNEKHWCHSLPGGRFGEMLIHPIYLLRHFLGNDLKIKNVEAYKLSSYPWVRNDELHVLLESRKKLGRIYVSFNSPREAIYISIIGDKGIVEAEVITGTVIRLNYLHAPSKYGKGKSIIKQVSQMMSSLIINTAKVVSHRWESGHQGYIRSFAESLMSGKDLPIPVEDTLKDVETLEEICSKL